MKDEVVKDPAKYHEQEWEGVRNAVFNPLDLDPATLPVIYGFNNGGNPGTFYSGVLLAQDGTCLGGHACSAEGYMPHDLGILEGTRPDRHEKPESATGDEDNAMIEEWMKKALAPFKG